MVKRLFAVPETQVQLLGLEYPLEKAVAPHSSILAWKISWMEEPGRLQSMGSQSRTQLSDFTFTFHVDYGISSDIIKVISMCSSSVLTLSLCVHCHFSSCLSLYSITL